jgi:DNA-binding IclR family transcriptional regulator
MNAAPPQEEEKKDRQFVTALARGLEILSCFTKATPALGTTEIARMTGLPQPTVWRLCHTLVQEGYLIYTDGGDRLRPGIPVLSLGFAALAGMPIADLAKEDMQAIAIKYEGAVSLGVREGLNMVYVQRVQGSAIVMRNLNVGSRVPLAQSATGWAYIAGLEESGRKALYKELAGAEGKTWPDTLKKIQSGMEGFSETGYILNKGQLHPQINAVAVPVMSEDNKVLLALSAGGISPFFDDAKLTQIGEELKKLAARLTPVSGNR